MNHKSVLNSERIAKVSPITLPQFIAKTLSREMEQKNSLFLDEKTKKIWFTLAVARLGLLPFKNFSLFLNIANVCWEFANALFPSIPHLNF